MYAMLDWAMVIPLCVICQLFVILIEQYGHVGLHFNCCWGSCYVQQVFFFHVCIHVIGSAFTQLTWYPCARILQGMSTRLHANNDNGSAVHTTWMHGTNSEDPPSKALYLYDQTWGWVSLMILHILHYPWYIVVSGLFNLFGVHLSDMCLLCFWKLTRNQLWLSLGR